MKLIKAIEIGELNAKEAGKKMPPDTLDALKLLIEAGKRVERYRYTSQDPRPDRLPGETKED